MNAIAVIDSCNGLAFNDRPQSRDRVLMERIARLTDDAPIQAEGHFARMLESYGFQCLPYAQCLQPGEWVWLDHDPSAQEIEQIDKLIVARFRNIYPADMWFTLEPQKPEWKKMSRQIFAGSSHDKIILEEFIHEQ